MRGYSAAPAGEAPLEAVSGRRWMAAAAVLAVGVASLALVFRPEQTEAVQVWIDSTAYNHCFLVLPVAAYLAWDRRQTLATAVPQPAPWLALAAFPLALCWLFAERAGIWEARQLLAMSLVQLLFLAVLGPRCWRALSAPLLYLFFLIPVGGFLTPYLQSFTAHFMATGLDWLGIPNYSSGATIEIPEGTFYVAEACAGLRFLIASVAFGVLYGCLIYTSPLRRLMFVALSAVVPIIANGFRALGLVALAHLVGSAAAVETDHVLYGWLFFSIVTFLLILVGLPFRQSSRAVPPPRKPGRNGPIAASAGIAAAVVILFAAAPRLLADRLDRAVAPAPEAAGLHLLVPPDCMTILLPARFPVRVSPAAPGTAETRAYRCRAGVFVVSLYRYPSRIAARPLFDPLHLEIAGHGWGPAAMRIFDTGSGAATQRWRITEFARASQSEAHPGEDRYAAVAAALWIDDRPAKSTLRGRLLQAMNALSRAAVPPVAAIVSYAAAEGPADGRRAVDAFLASATPSGLPPAADARSFSAQR